MNLQKKTQNLQSGDNTNFQRYVVNLYVPFPVILKQAGIKNISYEGNIFCPFHENCNSPSAKLYKGARGDTIYCYAERKTYRPSDVCVKGMIPQDIQTLYQRIWEQLSEGMKQSLLIQFGKPIEVLPEKWRTSADSLESFKRGEIPLEIHLLKILDMI